MGLYRRVVHHMWRKTYTGPDDAMLCMKPNVLASLAGNQATINPSRPMVVLAMPVVGLLKAVSHCHDVDPWWTHKYVFSVAPSRIFWHAKDFATSSKVDPDVGETKPGLYDGSQMSQCFYDVLRYSYDHFQSLGECEACLIVYPSGINFGTVWCLHNWIYTRRGHVLSEAVLMRLWLQSPPWPPGGAEVKTLKKTTIALANKLTNLSVREVSPTHSPTVYIINRCIGRWGTTFKKPIQLCRFDSTYLT